jgi:1,4-alpha-glucan branching enzyme
MQDWEQSIVSFIRKGKTTHETIMAVMNCTSVPRREYRVGAAKAGVWREVLNSDASFYGGSGLGNSGRVEALPIPCHGRPYSVQMTLPPLSIIFLKNDSTS